MSLDDDEIEEKHYCEICGAELVTQEEIRVGVHFACSSALYTDKMKDLTGF